MLGVQRIKTPVAWLEISRSLTDALSRSSMTTRRDLIVQIVDDTVEGHESMPIAWHVPVTSDIVLNASKIEGMSALRTTPASTVRELTTEWISRNGSYTGIDDGELIAESLGMDSPKAAMIRIRGVLAHEAAHSMWSHYLLDEWWSDPALSPEVKEIITQLDEIRIESMQIDRNDSFRLAMRLSSRMLLPTDEDIHKMRVRSGALDVKKIALNMVLSLGRRDQGMLLEYEVREIRYFAEDLLGFDRLESMREIWNEFCEIEDITAEHELAISLAEEWLALFEDEEEIELPGFLKMLLDLFGGLGEGAERQASNRKQWGTDEDMMPAGEAADAVFKPSKKCTDPECPICRGEEKPEDDEGHGFSRAQDKASYEHRKVRPAERAAASALAKRLERLSVRARSEIKVRSVAPPGRLKSRAALAQAADRSQGRATKAEPWQRTKRKHSDTPPLTVGIITDVSGSMGWAEDMVASTTWIVNKAVRHINGTTAAVTFGDRAEPVIGPGSKLSDRVTVRDADGGSEAFNEACAAVDGVLRLSDRNNGARILFVVCDGHLVAPGEMAAASKWVDKLVKSGCAVVWVNDDDASIMTRKYRGYPLLPKGARYVQASTADIGMVNKLADQVAKALESR